MRKNKGKFLIAIFAALLLLAAGCGNGTEKTTTQAPSTIAETKKETEAIVQEVETEESTIAEIEESEAEKEKPAETDPTTEAATIPEDSSLQVHFIDVGQADATLVICDGDYMLIDGGNVEDSSLIYSYLKDYDADQLDYLVCTHAHEDHVGGLSGALNFAQVDTVYCPTTSYDTKAFQNFVSYLDKQGKSITVPEVGDQFEVGSAECTILAVNDFDDTNNTSIVMKMVYGDVSFLFCADAEQEVEAEILDAGFDVDCTVMKIPHHGSDTSLSYRWLNYSMPEYGVISVGKDNSYGHPCENTLSKLRDADVTVYRTDMQGHIVCNSDGSTVWFEVERNADADTLANAGAGSKNEEINAVAAENEAETEEETEEEAEQSSGTLYILNTNTKKFHYPYCGSVKQMKESNKKESTQSREEIISQGYDPCKKCNP